MDGWNTIVSFWGPAHVQGSQQPALAVSFRGGSMDKMDMNHFGWAKHLGPDLVQQYWNALETFQLLFNNASKKYQKQKLHSKPM